MYYIIYIYLNIYIHHEPHLALWHAVSWLGTIPIAILLKVMLATCIFIAATLELWKIPWLIDHDSEFCYMA